MPNARHAFSCPDTVWEWLEERGHAHNMSRSAFICRLIRQEQAREASRESAQARIWGMEIETVREPREEAGPPLA